MSNVSSYCRKSPHAGLPAPRPSCSCGWHGESQEHPRCPMPYHLNDQALGVVAGAGSLRAAMLRCAPSRPQDEWICRSNKHAAGCGWRPRMTLCAPCSTGRQATGPHRQFGNEVYFVLEPMPVRAHLVHSLAILSDTITQIACWCLAPVDPAPSPFITASRL